MIPRLCKRFGNFVLLSRLYSPLTVFFGLALLVPLTDVYLPQEFHLSSLMRPIFIFAILGLGLNVVTGYTGLLNLGVAGFMAIGAYTYAILSCDVYPFQVGFWWSITGAIIVGAVAGTLLGLPTIRLRGDYLAIVTLGFGEIIQDGLKNLESITKGIQGISPLPRPTFSSLSFLTPTFFGYTLKYGNDVLWYYLLLAFVSIVVVLMRNLEDSRIGRAWMAIREDELAATCMGVNAVSSKLLAFATGAAVASFAGALWATNLGSSGEPGNYDFQISTIALCIVIVGGMGSVSGVLLGAGLMIGLNSVVLVKLSDAMMRNGLIDTSSVCLSPNNWKYMIFGFALILMMRFKPEGLLPSKLIKRELEGDKEGNEDDGQHHRFVASGMLSNADGSSERGER